MTEISEKISIRLLTCPKCGNLELVFDTFGVCRECERKWHLHPPLIPDPDWHEQVKLASCFCDYQQVPDWIVLELGRQRERFWRPRM